MENPFTMATSVRKKYGIDEIIEFFDSYPEQMMVLDDEQAAISKEISDIDNQLSLMDTNLVNLAHQICEERKNRKTGQNNAEARAAELKRLQSEDTGYAALLTIKEDLNSAMDEKRRQARFLDNKMSSMKRKYQLAMLMFDRASDIDVFNFKRSNQ